MADLIPGAEPLSAPGGPHGALVLHGFTGNPGSMRELAEAFVGAGFAVEMPLLPGHGTKVEDMLPTTWADWSGAAEATYEALAARVDKVVVAGLSMGGSLTAWLGARHPEIAGLVCINPAAESNPDMKAMVQAMVDGGEELMDGIGSDIAKPGVVETAYPQTPLRPLLTLLDASDDLQPLLPKITSPMLLLTSPEDHVVTPSNSDHLAASVSGAVERVSLDRSYHVATMDHDKDLILERAVEFARRVTA